MKLVAAEERIQCTNTDNDTSCDSTIPPHHHHSATQLSSPSNNTTPYIHESDAQTIEFYHR